LLGSGLAATVEADAAVAQAADYQERDEDQADAGVAVPAAPERGD
jgi:hypothetical protein